MKLSFTTLGCPDWDLDTLCKKGRECGFDGVDVRGLQETLDITLRPEFTSEIAQTRRKLADAGLEVCGISSSIRLCDPDKLKENVEEARRTMGVARELGCQRVRVFGSGNPQDLGRERVADLGQQCMEAILELEGARQFRWLLETHDEWTRARDCKLLLERVPDAAFGILWDMGHTSRVGGETPRQTWEAVGPRIGYTHVKDAIRDPAHPRAMKDGWRYVPPGTGQLPLAEAIALLREKGYEGWIMFEHEKRWHRELEEPEEIFPLFIEWARKLKITN